MPRCNNCSEFVTPEFTRVFGDNANTVYGCPDCVSASDILGGTIAADVSDTGRKS